MTQFIASFFVTGSKSMLTLCRKFSILLLFSFVSVSLQSHAAPLSDGSFLPEAELIVLLDTKSAQKIADSPEDAVRSVTSASKTPAERALFSALGSPLKARYVIQDRLTAEQLRLLRPDSPRIILDQFLVLSFADAAAADISKTMLTANKGISSVKKNTRFYMATTPSDPGFQSGPFGPGFMNYQWGLQQMNYPAAWDIVKGNAYVAVLDTGIQLGHPDLTANFKPHLSQLFVEGGTFDDSIGPSPVPAGFVRGHGTHVAGIIGANTNSGAGVAGGCWNCALLIGKISSGSSPPNETRVAQGIIYAADTGAQVINMSLGSYVARNCVGNQSDLMCFAIQHAVDRRVVMVAAAGNNTLQREYSPPDNGPFIGDVQLPANQPAVIPVGALQPTLGTRGRLWTETRVPLPPLPPNDESFSGSSTGPSMLNRGVVAPGMDVFSTIYTNQNYNASGYCGDFVEGSPTADGYGPCTGTSMAAPHISALVGLMRSVNPWVPPDVLRSKLFQASDRFNTPSAEEGHGQPDAAAAVAAMVLTNPGRLIPLMSLYSPGAHDYFYTTVPQMALAAKFGMLKRISFAATTYNFVGTPPIGFGEIPDGLFNVIPTAAQAWVIGTYQNPVTPAVALRPLIRMSYVCYDPPNPLPPGECTANPNHVDHLLSTDTNNEINTPGGLISAGYKIDGVEGYVFDRAFPQPVGTEPLIRAYNETLDDHAVFPLREQCFMATEGYTLDVTNLGYAYPVTSSPAPQPFPASLLAVKSRKTHASAGTFDHPLNVSIPICGLVSVEPRMGPSHQIVFQFTAAIPGPFSATVLDSGGNSLGSATASAVGTEVIVSLSGVADNKRAKITVTGNGGIVVGTVSVGFLIGDINDSGGVNSADINGVKARSGQSVDVTNFKYDLNVSGAIQSSDISMVKARSGLVLPN